MTLETVTRFWEWVRKEADRRGWSIRELERRAGLKRGRISNAANLSRAPTIETLEGLSRALGLSLVEIQREAGLLPSLPPAVEEEREVVQIFRHLPADVRRTVVTMMRGLASQAAAAAALTDPAVDYSTDDILVPELLEEFRQVPDEWKETAIAQMSQFRRAAEQPTPRIIGEDIETERNAEAPQV